MSDHVVQIILALVSGGFLVSVVNAVVNRRKLGADTGNVMVGTAERVIELVNTEMDRREVEHVREVRRLNDDATNMRKRIDGLEQHQVAQRVTLQAHAAWDFMALQKLRSVGIEIEDPPALNETVRR